MKPLKKTLKKILLTAALGAGLQFAAQAQSVNLTNLVSVQPISGSVTGAVVTASVPLPVKYFQSYSGGITNAPNYVTNIVGSVTNIVNTVTNSKATTLQLSLDNVNWVTFPRTNFPAGTNVETTVLSLSGLETIFIRPVVTTTNPITGGVQLQQ